MNIGHALRRFTLCLAYYENPTMLLRQLESLEALPAWLRRQISLVVVDDGSPVPAALPRTVPSIVAARLYRITVNVPWNQDAARNLAVEQSKDLSEWVLLTDMDHVPTLKLWERLVGGALAEGFAYTFARVNAPAHEEYKAHPNSWAMTQKLYDQAGGYDERYAGIYGTDGMFASRLQQTANAVMALPEALIRFPREVIADASTVSLERKSPANNARRKALGAAIKAQGDQVPKRGLFPWVQVA